MSAGFVFITGVEEGPNGEMVFNRREMLDVGNHFLLRDLEPVAIRLSLNEEDLSAAIEAGYERLGRDIGSQGECCQEPKRPKPITLGDESDIRDRVNATLSELLGISPEDIEACDITEDCDEFCELHEGCEAETGVSGHDAINHREVEVSNDGVTWIPATLVWVEPNEHYEGGEDEPERIFVAVPDGERHVRFFCHARAAL